MLEFIHIPTKIRNINDLQQMWRHFFLLKTFSKRYYTASFFNSIPNVYTHPSAQRKILLTLCRYNHHIAHISKGTK